MNAFRMIRRYISFNIILMINIVLMITTPVLAAELSEKTDTGTTSGVHGYTEVRAEVVIAKDPEKPQNPNPVSPDSTEPEDTTKKDEESHPQTGNTYPVFVFMIILIVSAMIVIIMKICRCQ